MTTRDALTSQVLANFGLDGGGGGAPVVELEPGVYLDYNNRHLLVYPHDAKVTTDAGRLEKHDPTIVTVSGAVVAVSNSDRFNLPRIPITVPEQFLTVLFAFSPTGQPLNGVTAWYDSAAQLIKLSATCYAAVKYTDYPSKAGRYTYYPDANYDLQSGYVFTYGMIAAYHNSQLTLFELPLATLDQGETKIELYKVVSEKVLTLNGEYEKPPNYPDNTYPGMGVAIDMTNSVLQKRVHEIGYINERGYAWAEQLYVRILEPYVGVLSYTPVTSVEKNTLDPSKYPPSLVLKGLDFLRSRGYAKGT